MVEVSMMTLLWVFAPRKIVVCQAAHKVHPED